MTSSGEATGIGRLLMRSVPFTTTTAGAAVSTVLGATVLWSDRRDTHHRR